MKKQVWSKGIIRLLCAGMKEVFVPGYIKEGLGVHKSHLESGKVDKHRWAITHLDSGMRVNPDCLSSRSEALFKADQLLCIEGLFNLPLEAFPGGMREIDCIRINKILGTKWVEGVVGEEIKEVLKHRANSR